MPKIKDEKKLIEKNSNMVEGLNFSLNDFFRFITNNTLYLPISVNILIEKYDIYLSDILIHLKDDNKQLFKAVEDYYNKLGILTINLFRKQN